MIEFIFLSNSHYFRNSNMPTSVYDSIMKEFNRLQNMSIVNPEFSVSIQYLSYVANLPWSKSSIETLDLEKAKSVSFSII